MALKITLKAKRNGVLAGVAFKNGVGTTAKLGANVRNYFESIGATIAEISDPAKTEADAQSAAEQAAAEAAAAVQAEEAAKAQVDADAASTPPEAPVAEPVADAKA